jgi:hypothetical protein
MCNKQTQIYRKDAFGIYVLGYNNFVLFNFPKGQSPSDPTNCFRGPCDLNYQLHKVTREFRWQQYGSKTLTAESHYRLLRRTKFLISLPLHIILSPEKHMADSGATSCILPTPQVLHLTEK